MSSLFPTEVWKNQAHKNRPIGRFFQNISYQRIGFYTAISDFVLILAASIATGVAYHFLIKMDGDVEAFAFVGCYSGLMFVLLTNALGLYQPRLLLSANYQIRGVVVTWGAVLLFMASVLFLLKTGANYSRGATISFGLVGLGFILASRAIARTNFHRALDNNRLVGQRAIVIGDVEELAAKSSNHLLRAHGAREVGRFELPPTDHHRSNIERDIRLVEAGIRAAQSSNAECVLLALRWSDTERRDLICERLRVLPLPVLLLPDEFVRSVLGQTHRGFSAETPIEVQRAPLSREDQVIKRIFDLVLASFGLVAFALPAAAICLALILDSAGPVIFRQRRRGSNGRVFGIYKFRTMTVLEDGPAIRQARRDDNRVTRVGRVLRAASLDEVPQLINVLKGEMSLVGPRPHAIAHDDEYSDSINEYAFRQHVKPGITGWAQVHGYRGATDDVALMKKRVEFDLWYINNWSLWLDLRIMARTCVEIFRFRNAY